MGGSSQEGEEKRNITEVEIFPVPFALNVIQEDIYISTNALSKASKDQIIYQAIRFHLEGNISEAAKYYQYCIKQGFKDHRVFSNYGVILRDLGKLNEAEICTHKAIEIKSDYPDAYSNLGMILRDLGKLHEAEICTHKAIEIKSDYPEAHSNLGIILKDLGKLREAEIYTHKAIEINPNYAEAHFNLGVLLKDLGKLQEAEISYLKAIEIKPNFADAYSNLGNILSDLGKSEKAELSYRKAIEINPDYAEAHFNLGVLLKNLDKSQEAEISYRKAIEINPDYAEAHSNLGVLLNNLGNFKEAELSYRKAIKIKPNFAEAHSNLGKTLIELGQLQEAEFSTRKAIELNPDFAKAYLNLGTTLKDLGKLQDAFDSYLKVIKINPSLPNIYPSITRFLKDCDPSQLNNSNLKKILNLLLERNDVPHKELQRAFNFVYRNEIIISLEKLDSDFSNTHLLLNKKVIINAFKKITFKDIRLEKLLTNVRKYLCKKITKNKEEIIYSELQLIIALGEQCFLNEYVYSLTEEEKISLKTIIKRCQDNELSEANISILSCYFPLYKLLNQIPSLKSFNSSNQSFKELIELQITEPIIEIELSQRIKK